MLAVARAAGADVGYLPGLVRRIANLHAGEAKTDARDTVIIAQAARSMPHALRALRPDDKQIAELALLSGFDDDLAKAINQTSNRLRGLLTQVHPALERAIGPRLDHPAILDMLTRYHSPEALRAAASYGARPRCPAVREEPAVSAPEPLVYSVEEAATALGIDRSLAFDLVRRGELPTLRLGRRRVIPRHLLQNWLESRTSASGDQHPPAEEGRQCQRSDRPQHQAAAR